MELIATQENMSKCASLAPLSEGAICTVYLSDYLSVFLCQFVSMCASLSLSLSLSAPVSLHLSGAILYIPCALMLIWYPARTKES
jgi:hypothetical protein